MARTYTVYETPASRQFEYQTPGLGQTKFTYNLLIRPDSGDRGTDNQEYQAAYAALSTYLGDQLGKLQSVSVVEGSGGNLLGNVGAVRNITFDPVPDTDFVYRSTVTFITEFPPTTDTASDSFAFSGTAGIAYRATPQTRVVDTYKLLRGNNYPGIPTSSQQSANPDVVNFATGFVLTAIDTTADPPTENTAVQNLDIAFKPVPMRVAQMRIEITEPWASTNSAVLNNTNNLIGSWPSWTANVDLIGRRNGAAFLGANEGELLYLGTSCAPRQFHTYTLTHVFLWDEWSHFNQMPLSGFTGLDNVAVIEDSTHPLGAFQCNESVLWTNPYPIGTYGDTTFEFANAATTAAVANGASLPKIFENPGASGAEGPVTR